MPAHLTPEVEENLTKKMLYHLDEREVDDGQLKISVFTDDEHLSYALWKDVLNTELHCVTRFPLIPVPSDCLSDHYSEFVDLVSNFIENFLDTRENCESTYWGIVDFGEREHPKLNLILTNRYLKKEEFGKWLTLTEVGRKHILSRMNMKHRKQRKFQHRDEPEITIEPPPAAAPADPLPLSSSSRGPPPEVPTARKTDSPFIDVRIDPEILRAFRARTCGEGRPESETSSYATDTLGDSKREENSSESVVGGVPIPEMFLFTVRRRVFEALGESVDETSEPSETALRVVKYSHTSF